jgi:hypothetical protein
VHSTPTRFRARKFSRTRCASGPSSEDRQRDQQAQAPLGHLLTVTEKLDD